MAMLSGPKIIEEIKKGTIVIEPFNAERVNPNSVNLTLGPRLLVYCLSKTSADGWTLDVKVPDPVLDMRKDNPVRELEIGPDGLVLLPNTLYLGSTVEYTETNGFVPCIEGRSSIGRLGLATHVTAGFGDNNFKGRWTLELTTVHPLRIYAGVEICQIAYHTLEGEPRKYQGKYQDSAGPEASKLWKEFSG